MRLIGHKEKLIKFSLLTISYMVLLSFGFNKSLASVENKSAPQVDSKPQFEEKYHTIASAVEKKINHQNNLLIQQKDEIEALKELIKEKQSGMPFEVWSGILLAVSALILGAVGIGIAVFSFFGYKELINKGVEKATAVATDVSKDVSESAISNMVEEKVTNQINQLMDDGSFDHAVIERVENYIYRGVETGFHDDFEDASSDDRNE